MTPRRLNLAGMPSEVLLLIGDELEHEDGAMAAMALTCRRFNEIFEPLLYRHSVRCAIHGIAPECLIWGAVHNRVGTMAKVVKAMESHTGACLDTFGTNPNRVDQFDHPAGTALHWAAWYGNDEAVEVLLQRSASLNVSQNLPNGHLPTARKRTQRMKWMASDGFRFTWLSATTTLRQRSS